MDILGFEIDDSVIRIFITLVSPFMIWLLKLLLSDLFLGAPILATVENTDECVRFHLYNRTSKRFVIYGAFLSRSERLRAPLVLSEDTIPESDLTFRLNRSDLSSAFTDWKKITHRNDTHIPAKLILDTSRGRFYSQWMIIDDSRGYPIVSPSSGHRDSFYTVRRRPTKHNLDAILFLYYFLMIPFFPIVILDLDLSPVESDSTAMIVLFINMLVSFYYAGYGFERIGYGLLLAILSVAPSIPIFYIIDGAYSVIPLLLLIVFCLFPMFFSTAGYGINGTHNGHYYLYDFHHNEDLEHAFEESRRSKGVWYQFLLFINYDKYANKNDPNKKE